MSSLSPMSTSKSIPILLLKTRTQPKDIYEEYFSPQPPDIPSQPCTSSISNAGSSEDSTQNENVRFSPTFVPVLEHTPNTRNLARLETLLSKGKLKKEYGGMIFTSQRAVEGWRAVVERVESDTQIYHLRSTGILSNPITTLSALDYTDPILALQDSDLPFPLYVVGPATERTLSDLLEDSRRKLRSLPSKQHNEFRNGANPNPSRLRNTTYKSDHSTSNSNNSSPFLSLNPKINGAHTGSGATLAPFILSHYNTLHSQRLFTFWEAPRLPFIPLVGPGPSPSKSAHGTIVVGTQVDTKAAGGNASVVVRRGGMIRLELADARLIKKPLLFLVGETRRDVIPKTLMDEGLGERMIQVEELEVYGTQEKENFSSDFAGVLDGLERERHRLVAVVVFSPQGCESMLKAIGYIDSAGKLTQKARRRWQCPDAVGRGDDNTVDGGGDYDTAEKVAENDIADSAAENDTAEAEGKAKAAAEKDISDEAANIPPTHQNPTTAPNKPPSAKGDPNANTNNIKDTIHHSSRQPQPQPQAQPPANDNTTYIVATIGPTTRDFLFSKFNFEPDVVATTPSPEGIGEGVKSFLEEKRLVL